MDQHGKASPPELSSWSSHKSQIRLSDSNPSSPVARWEVGAGESARSCRSASLELRKVQKLETCLKTRWKQIASMCVSGHLHVHVYTHSKFEKWFMPSSSLTFYKSLLLNVHGGFSNKLIQSSNLEVGRTFGTICGRRPRL